MDVRDLLGLAEVSFALFLNFPISNSSGHRELHYFMSLLLSLNFHPSTLHPRIFDAYNAHSLKRYMHLV